MKTWLILTMLLGAGHAADGWTTARALGGHFIEENTFDYGRHPSDARIAVVHAAYFGGEIALLAKTERSKRAWVRWSGRLGVAALVAWHGELATHNARLSINREQKGVR